MENSESSEITETCKVVFDFLVLINFDHSESKKLNKYDSLTYFK